MTKIRTAKIYVNSTEGPRCLGCVLLISRKVEEYEVMDDANGETPWFPSWSDVCNYVFEHMCYSAFFMRGKKVIGNVLFNAVLG